MNLREFMVLANSTEVATLESRVQSLSTEQLCMLVDMNDEKAWLTIETIDYPSLRNLRMLAQVMAQGA